MIVRTARTFSRLVLAATILLLLFLVFFGVSELSGTGIALLALAAVVLTVQCGQIARPYLPAVVTRASARFSLRTLLILMVVVGISLAWLGDWMREIRAQRRIIEQLSARGFQFTFDDPWARWMHARLGMNGAIAGRGLREVSMDRKVVEEADVAALNGLRFQSIWLHGCLELTDDEVARLKPSATLKHFEAPGSRLGDKTLEHLSHFDDLETINLWGSPITDEGVAPLTRMRRLQTLALPYTPITDGAVEHLKQMKQLRTLAVPGTAITPQGVDELRKALPGCVVIH